MPFSRDLPFRIDATMTAIGMEWVTTTDSDYVRLATDGQVVAQVPLPGIGQPTDGQPRLAWNGDALAYVGGDETGAYLAMVDVDGSNWRRGSSDASVPLATDGRIGGSVGGGFRATYRVASNSTVAFATADATGAWTATGKMPVPGEPLALTSLAQQTVGHLDSARRCARRGRGRDRCAVAAGRWVRSSRVHARGARGDDRARRQHGRRRRHEQAIPLRRCRRAGARPAAGDRRRAQ